MSPTPKTESLGGGGGGVDVKIGEGVATVFITWVKQLER